MVRYFTTHEFDCPCCGESKMDIAFVMKLDNARGEAGTPFVITSGYRCVKHNLELGSTSKNHTSGHAADIACTEGQKRIKILRGLIVAGFKRIGMRKDFIHVDDTDYVDSCWLY